MIQYIMKHKCAEICNILKRLPFYDLKRYILEAFKACHHHPPIPTVTWGIVIRKKDKKTKEKVLRFAFTFWTCSSPYPTLPLHVFLSYSSYAFLFHVLLFSCISLFYTFVFPVDK